MSEREKCPNGHIYDRAIYGDNCPFCFDRTKEHENPVMHGCVYGGPPPFTRRRTASRRWLPGLCLKYIRLLMKHLQGGVKKGAFDEAHVDGPILRTYDELTRDYTEDEDTTGNGRR